MSNAKQRRAARRMADGASRDGLQNVVAGLGTNRDKMSFTEYATPTILTRDTLGNMYRDSWLSRKIVDIPAEDMTRTWRQVMFDDESVGDKRVDNQFDLEDAERSFQLRAKVRQALTWARLYGGSVLLLGVGDQKDYDKPLDPASVKKGDLRFIMPFDRWLCIPVGDYDYRDISSPDFGMPEFYTIAQAKSLRIHRSRVIRFIGRELPYYESLRVNRWGDSVLQSVYDTLRSRDTVSASIASMMFEANVDVVKAPDLAEMLATPEGESILIKRFQTAAMLKSFNRMLLLDGTEEYEKKSNSFSGLDSIMREFRTEVAGAADIPVSRLFGISASGLNASGDNEVRNYYDMVRAQQEAALRPALEKLDEVLLRHVFGSIPDDYRFEFPSLWQTSDTEKANIQKTRADRDKIYYDMGVLTEGAIARELKESGTFTTMTEQDVKLAEELASEPDPEPADPFADPLNPEDPDDLDPEADEPDEAPDDDERRPE